MGDSFVVEVSLGDIRLKICTGDNKSFSLMKQSAEGIHVDFSSFTGTLCINKNCSSPESALLSQHIGLEGDDSINNVSIDPIQECALPTDIANDSGDGGGESTSVNREGRVMTERSMKRRKRSNRLVAKRTPNMTISRATRARFDKSDRTMPSEFGSRGAYSVRMHDTAIWSLQQ